jgi:hypothetical protein
LSVGTNFLADEESFISNDTAFLFVYPDKRCARCVNVAPVARNVSRHGRNETATLATLLHNRAGPIIESSIENNMVPLKFSRDQES